MNSDEENQENSMIGKRVGVYELKREVGRGGMGAVYLAERADGEFRQTVAIKLIKRGMDTDSILKRFRRERQIIASLDHPNIAYFLSGGSTDEGLPYFVMEFIDGKPLYNFCSKNRLTINERLRIFRQICEAVEVAHQRKIIHRDLKPSNILVKADGAPKLLDFGIAKVLDADLMAADFDSTATAMRVMTPEYASPEQISGEEITTASDIYSLGIILYEILTGHRPYKLKRQVPHEIARIICEEMPSRPSTRSSGDDAETQIPTLEYISRNLNSSDEINNPKSKIQNPKSDDLDKIVLKSLRKNPAERYLSAADFAADITNYLENRPVKAENFWLEDRTKTRSDKKAVAILPFRMIGAENSKNTDDIFLGIGLADALVSRLSGVQRLIVRPTSSVLPFAEKNPIEAGNKIGVDFILDGNIRRVGERIRITVQLLNVAESATVWAEKFDENFTDVLELEDLISEKVAKVLLPQLTGEERRRLEKRGTNKPDAYQAYLRGRYFANQFTDESLLKSIEAYEEAVRLDSEYALAHVGIADFHVWSAIFGAVPCQKAYPQAKHAAERALEVDDSLGEAFAILAFITMLYDWDWTQAELLIKRALELNPNYNFAHECYSNFFSTQGIFDKAVSEIIRAEELDPLSPRAKLMTSYTHYQARNFPEAINKARQANEMQTNFAQGFLHLGNALTENSNIKEAVYCLTESVKNWENSAMPKFMLCFALAADAQFEKAREILDEMLIAAANGHVKPYFIAMTYAALGEIDNAFKWFEKSIEERDEWMIWFGTEPKLDELRKDPRYLELLRKTNNPIIASQNKIANAQAEKSIAVLPFKFLSSESASDSEDEYLSIGLADALTMRLSNVRRFLVRPTSSVLPFGEKETDSFAAGRELGVDFVLDGNIRRVGKRIRVAVQLLNVSENSTRWAQRYDENYTDVLTLEDSISERVTKSLLPKLTGEERRQLAKRGTNNSKAFEAYMRGRFFWNQFTPAAFPKTLESFEKAVELDKNYALAYVGIADFYAWATIYGIIPPIISYPKVFAAATRALEIDDSLGEAYATLGIYNSNNRNWSEAEKNYRRAIELSPNYSHGHEWLASVLVGTERFEEGIAEMYLAEKLDPLSLRTKTLTAWTTYQAGKYEESLKKAREIIAFDPDFPQGYLQLGNVLLELGEIEEALEVTRKAVELMSDSPLPIYNFCFALVSAGRFEEAVHLVAELKNKAAQIYVPPYFLAMAHLAIGEPDTAFEYFRAVFEEKSAWCIWFKTEPKLAAIRRDERYSELLKLM